MKNNLLKYYISAIYLCFTVATFAQPGNGSTGDPLESGDPAAPIDDYLWVLALIGLVYGFLRRQFFTQQETTQE